MNFKSDRLNIEESGEEILRYCNICGWRGKSFNILHNERTKKDEESVCPNCNSQPRQRALFRYLQNKEYKYKIGGINFFKSRLLKIPIYILSKISQRQSKNAFMLLVNYLRKIKQKNLLVLEIAPGLSPVEKVLRSLIYISIDLKRPAIFKMDLTNLYFEDFTFYLIVCSHVLEHIKNDSVAIEEIYKVLKKNGVALIQIPIGYSEDPEGKCTKEFSERRFYGHVRSYGWDFDRRLSKVGFKVDIIHFKNAPSELGIEKEVIFKCEKYEKEENNGKSM